MKKHTQAIRRHSRIGLWGSVGVIILTVAFIYSPWTFRPSAYSSRWMLIAGAVLAVLAVSMVLLSARRTVPRLRQEENMEKKLSGYAYYVREIYITLLVVIAILCCFTLLSGRPVLLMLAMVSALVLFLNYPNIYRVKVDLGLTDDEMKQLYGDEYVDDGKE